MVIAVAMPLSLRFGLSVGQFNPTRVIIISGGAITFNAISERLQPGPGAWSCFFQRRPRSLTFVPRFHHGGGLLTITLPMWMPLALLTPAAVWLLRNSRKPGAHACPRCAYDLAGLDGPCPECGMAPGPR
ncbi:MAG: hypothetical protein ACF8R7_12655 [Phycisphaerales bacterium JB039]